MPPDRSSFKALNLPSTSVPDWMGSFTLAAQPNTDLWRNPPHHDILTAPILYTGLRRAFVSAEVTVSADWELEWDQAGLVIFSGPPHANAHNPHLQPPGSPSGGEADTLPPYRAPSSAWKWVKVGLEYCNNECHASSVSASSDGADRALATLPPYQVRRSDLRVKLERIGYALWLWYEDVSGGWKKLRELTGFFWALDDKAVCVGVWASRPASLGSLHHDISGNVNEQQRSLQVHFEGLEMF